LNEENEIKKVFKEIKQFYNNPEKYYAHSTFNFNEFITKTDDMIKQVLEEIKKIKNSKKLISKIIDKIIKNIRKPVENIVVFNTNFILDKFKDCNFLNYFQNAGFNFVLILDELYFYDKYDLKVIFEKYQDVFLNKKTLVDYANYQRLNNFDWSEAERQFIKTFISSGKKINLDEETLLKFNPPILLKLAPILGPYNLMVGLQLFMHCNGNLLLRNNFNKRVKCLNQESINQISNNPTLIKTIISFVTKSNLDERNNSIIFYLLGGFTNINRLVISSINAFKLIESTFNTKININTNDFSHCEVFLTHFDLIKFFVDRGLNLKKLRPEFFKILIKKIHKHLYYHNAVGCMCYDNDIVNAGCEIYVNNMNLLIFLRKNGIEFTCDGKNLDECCNDKKFISNFNEQSINDLMSHR